jgi:hypothetical protein
MPGSSPGMTSLDFKPKHYFQIIFAFTLVMSVVVASASAIAENSKCWGYGSDDTTRPDISCTPITERLLLSLRGMTKAQVVKTMHAGGRPLEMSGLEGLRFLSNASRGGAGSGNVNVTFKDGRVFIVDAHVDAQGLSGDLEYLWNAELGGCSDFPDSHNTCRSHHQP